MEPIAMIPSPQTPGHEKRLKEGKKECERKNERRRVRKKEKKNYTLLQTLCDPLYGQVHPDITLQFWQACTFWLKLSQVSEPFTRPSPHVARK
jgi:hypothetical protein